MIAPTSFFADYGCHVRILEEIRVLQKLGHQVTVVTYHNGQDLPGVDIRRTLPIPWRQDYEVGSSRHKIAFDMLLGWKTLALLARERFDLIHAHLHEGALIGMVLGRLFRLPVIFDFQGSLTEEMVDHGFLRRDGRFYSLMRLLERWIDRSVPSILTSTAHAKRLLIEQFHCGESQVQTLPDCVSADVFCPSSAYAKMELAELRANLGIPEDRKLIVYLGLLAEHQGISHLLRALQQIVSQRQDVHLLLMGFPNLAYYKELAQQLGITEYVTFTGRVSYHEAPRYLALGDIAVAPKLSVTEGAGKLLNYMAVGLPTVAFDSPVAREYLGLDGVFARRGDVDSLVEKLLEIIDLVANQPESARFMGERLRQHVVQHFSWDMAGRQIISIYDHLIERRAMPSLRHQRWAMRRET
ncbi:MAG: glycosyltransferase family 4 protein [Caldilineaceae bacterium]|nr:glycosyltransferase family 4 protein [Caldilineaceae bacterium]